MKSNLPLVNYLKADFFDFKLEALCVDVTTRYCNGGLKTEAGCDASVATSARFTLSRLAAALK